MLDLAIGGYTRQQVINELHAIRGSRDISFRLALLNERDVEIGSPAAELGGRINQNSQAEITRTANFTISETDSSAIDWMKDRIKPYFRIKMPDGNFIEWPLGVFLLSSPARKDMSNRIQRSVEAYDKSIILRDDKFTSRYFVAKTTLYTTAIRTILESAGIWKISITASTATLVTDKEFEIGTTKLSAINSLLKEINYKPLLFDPDGYAVIYPYQDPTGIDADYEYRTNDISVVHPDAIDELDLFDIPNQWVVTSSNPERAALVSTYINSLSTSPTSTLSRGRTIVDYRTVDDVFDQTTLDAYVRRIAYEQSQVYGRFVFNTAIMPHHTAADCLYLEYNRLSIAAKFVELSWAIDLTPGGKMSHEVRRLIRI